MRLRARGAAVGAAAAVLTVGLALPAAAVQTDTFGLVAAGQRTLLVAHPTGSAYRDSVFVYNRKATPVTVQLAVVSATRGHDGVFSYGGPGRGLAARVHLAATTVRLAPNATQQIAVTVDTPRRATQTEYAAITAQAAPTQLGQLAVVARLALFVQLTPGNGSSRVGLPIWLFALAATAILATAGAQVVVRQRQR